MCSSRRIALFLTKVNRKEREKVLLERIRAKCKEQNITIAELERKAKIGNGVIRRWDELNPRLDNLMQVADALGVPVYELLREDGDDTANE